MWISRRANRLHSALGNMRTEIIELAQALEENGLIVPALVGSSRICEIVLKQICLTKKLKAPETFEKMIEFLRDKAFLPNEIASNLHTIRIWANKARHGSEKNSLLHSDGEISLLLLLRFLEWYYCQSECPSRLEKLYTHSHMEAPNQSDNQTIFLGQKDTHVCIIGGDGIREYFPQHIICRLNRKQLIPPEFLQRDIESIKKQELLKKKNALPYAWNGKMIHIEKFNDARTQDAEELHLEFSVCLGQYYHFLATTAAMHQCINKQETHAGLRETLIGDFNRWRFEIPPNILAGLPVSLFVVTQDSKLIFSRRSPNVAIAANQIAATINENIHPDHDFTGIRNQLDFQAFIYRALAQEIGWIDSEHSGTLRDPKAEIHILLFAVDIERIDYGILGYVNLPITYEQLWTEFKENCSDRFEIAELIPVAFNQDAICQFIHEQELYSMVGLGACYTMIHQGVSLKLIQNRFHFLQGIINSSLSS